MRPPFILLLLLGCLLMSSIIYGQTTVPKQILGGVVNGKAISLPKPIYPIEAKKEFASGKVNVQVTIDEQGNVISARAVAGHPMLLKVSEEAALKAKFSPTRLSGKPVKVVGTIVYKFVSTEIEEPYWALSMLFAFTELVNPKMIQEIGDPFEFDKIFGEISDDLPIEFADQKVLFSKLKTATPLERKEIVKEIRVSIKTAVKGHRAWQFELGEMLAVILLEVIKFKLNEVGKDFGYSENSLVFALQKIKTLTDAPPDEISKEFIDTFKKLGKFAEEPELKTKIALLFERVSAVFELIED